MAALSFDNRAGEIAAGVGLGCFEISTRCAGNFIELDCGGDWFLFSYGRLVAAGVLVVGGRRMWFKDEDYYSVTTSKHINSFIRQGFRRADGVGVTVQAVSFEKLRELLAIACHNL